MTPAACPKTLQRRKLGGRFLAPLLLERRGVTVAWLTPDKAVPLMTQRREGAKKDNRQARILRW